MAKATARAATTGSERATADSHIVKETLSTRGGFLACIVILVWPSVVLAAEWRVTPRIELRQTYTDNLRLAPKGQEESDFVSEVNPAISVAARGARLEFQADYGATYRVYAKNSDENTLSHALRSRGLLEVLDRNLFVEAAASIAQQNISALGAQPTSDVNLTDNRTEVRQFSVSPYWTSRLGSFATFRARYDWRRAETDGAASALNSETRGINVGLSSGPAFHDLGWSASYSKQEVESSHDTFQKRTLESITGSLSYRLLPTLSALASVGRDDNTFEGARGKTGGSFYSAGLQWVPSARTRVRAEFGERYFGNTMSFDASHRTRLTTWTLNYSEQIVATPGLFTLPVNVNTALLLDQLFVAQFPDPIERQQIVQAFIVQNGLPNTIPTAVDFLTNQVTLSERLQGTFALRGVRSTFLTTLFRDNRRSETTGGAGTIIGTDPFSQGQRVEQTGYSAILSWRFSERTAGSFSLGQTRSEVTDANRKDVTSNIRIGLTHQLQPKLRGSIEYRWLNLEADGSRSDVRENAITGTLSLAF